jgi:hypothetical protein
MVAAKKKKKTRERERERERKKERKKESSSSSSSSLLEPEGSVPGYLHCNSFFNQLLLNLDLAPGRSPKLT